MGNVRNVGKSGVKCGEFYVNDNIAGIYSGKFDLVDLKRESRERGRERLVECWVRG